MGNFQANTSSSVTGDVSSPCIYSVMHQVDTFELAQVYRNARKVRVLNSKMLLVMTKEIVLNYNMNPTPSLHSNKTITHGYFIFKYAQRHLEGGIALFSV